MLDTFLKLIEQLISLARERQRDRAALFNDVVEPFFVQLEPVAEDYFRLFRSLRRSIEDHDKQWYELAELLSDESERMAHARVLIRQMAGAMLDRSKDAELTAFAEAVEDFFGQTTHHQLPTKSVAFARRVMLNSPDMRVRQASVYAAEELQRLENAWSALGRSYATLRLNCLGPSGYIKKS